jgi:hypothetical protein
MNKLELLNFGLVGKLAVVRIDSYDVQNAQGEVVRAVYPLVLESAVESFNWAFARVVSDGLAKVGESADGLEIYQLPNGVEQITAVYNNDGFEISYRQEGQTIVLLYENLGQNQTLHVRYVELLDEGKFPAYFGKAVAVDFAAQACMTLTENGTLADRLAVEAEKLYKKARRLSNLSAGQRNIAPMEEYSMLSQRRG